jgi:UDP-N-acetylglucosamine 2-epimerase
MKIASVDGSTPDFTKLAPLHRAIGSILDRVITHTCQHCNYKMSDVFLKELDLPEPNFDFSISSGSRGFQISQMINVLEQIFLKNNFDVFIVYGDTNSTLVAALAANRLGLKTSHMQSGLTCLDRCIPEEIYRILTDNICDYLFAPTKIKLKKLKREDVHDKILDTGQVGVKIIETENTASFVGNGLGIYPQFYIFFTLHRPKDTNSKDDVISIIRLFQMLDVREIVSLMHSRIKRRTIESGLYDELKNHKNVRLIQEAGYIILIKLMQNIRNVVSDLAGLQKEWCLLHVPFMAIRRDVEWLETVKAGWNLIIDTNTKNVAEAYREGHLKKLFKLIFHGGKVSNNIKKIDCIYYVW